MVFKRPVHDELQPAAVPQYYVEGDHEAIIPKELIEKITVFAYHFTVEFKSASQSTSKHKKAPLLPIMAVWEPFILLPIFCFL